MHSQKTGWQLGMQSGIVPGLPMHLVQESNVSTVEMAYKGKPHNIA